MLPRENRLKGKKAFDEIKNHGTFQHTGVCIIGILKREDSDPSRFGVVVSKKVSNKAVVRNKIKRLIKRVIENYITGVKNGNDILIIAKSNMKNIDEKKANVIIKDAMQNFNLLS